ncbi:hypothetical protein BDN72DRAFT_781429 [Pluteus cervinus]|uniref:Uncharacterized protein n=1 Tax=Pluteus cervinus TaxID=181527 RepID=A0ACD3A0K7_9AGAR|nr:hypothetical protein BDN72DRAFT_781429 [Pluteus cervinus]
MHNLFLGDLKKHCRDYLGMTVQANKSNTNRIPPHTTEDQQKSLDAVKSILLRGDRKDSLFNAIRKTYLLAYVEANNLAGRAAAQMTKAELQNLLQNWVGYTIPYVIKHPQPLDEPVVSLQEPDDEPEVIILDSVVIGEIVGDMEKTIKPSWLASAPRTLGDPGHGKLSADQWRTVCTINMVITLIRIWTPGSNHHQYLENFLHLITAIRWATMRTSSTKQVTLIKDHFKRYCETTVELFGENALVPNTHMSLHLAECIEAFGPVHGWWAFPFERYNGIIQRQNSNNKVGELEVTFTQTFCRGANLKGLMSLSDLPGILSQLKPLFNKCFGPEFRGTLLSDLLARGSDGQPQEMGTFDPKNAKGLPNPEYSALLAFLQHRQPNEFCHHLSYSPASPHVLPISYEAEIVSEVISHGVTYSTAAHHEGNSQVFLYTPEGARRAGQIRQIFKHRRQEIKRASGGPRDGNETITTTTTIEFFVVIQLLCELDTTMQDKDPYRKYPLLEIALYEARNEPQLLVTSLDNIVSHYAICPFSGSAIGEERDFQIVLSLDRVCVSYSSLSHS